MLARPKILYLLHCYFNRAGTEGHVKALVEGLRDKYDLTIAFPHQDKIIVVQNEQVVQTIAASEVPWPVTPYEVSSLSRGMQTLFEKINPDLIHIQHFLRWPLSLIDRAVDSGRPVALSFHDYYALTPYYTMEGFSPEQTLSREYSLAVFKQDISRYLVERREILSKSLLGVSRLTAPSNYLREQLERFFPVAIQVLELGIQPFSLQPRRTPDGRLRFGFFGSIVPQKGWLQLLQAFQRVVELHPQAELHFFGGADSGVPQIESNLVRFHGKYETAELPHLLAQVEVGVIPSLFPETYNLVLSEMRLAQLPVAVADIGALSERVQDGANGRKFRAGDLADMADKLSWFCRDQSWRGWQIPQPRLVHEMCAEFDALYREMLGE